MNMELPCRLSSSSKPSLLTIAPESSSLPDSKPPRRARWHGYGRCGAGVMCTRKVSYPPDLVGLPHCRIVGYGWWLVVLWCCEAHTCDRPGVALLTMGCFWPLVHACSLSPESLPRCRKLKPPHLPFSSLNLPSSTVDRVLC